MRSRLGEGPPTPEAPGEAASLADDVRACLRPGFLADLRRLYDRVEAASARGPERCLGGGACCRFDLAGHRLYVSTGELALLVSQGGADGLEPGRSVRLRCPYQYGPRCRARAVRPLGCRVYFCRPVCPEHARARYEKYHRLIRLLHHRHRLPYRYVELTSALAELRALRHGGGQ